MKILVIQLRKLGDVILSTPIPREIENLLGEGLNQIDFLVYPEYASVLENNPHIHNIIHASNQTKQFWKSAMYVRKQRYDYILDPQNTPRSMYYTILSKARKKVVREDSSRALFYNTKVSWEGSYISEERLNVLQAFGVDISKEKKQEVKTYKPEIFLTDSERKEALDILHSFGIKKEDFIVVISPTSVNVTRKWGIENFKKTAEYLVKEYNAKIIVTCTESEIKDVQPFLQMEKNNIFVLKSLDIRGLCSIISQSKLFIGNDSAPHHMASAFDTPSMVIVGSIEPVCAFPTERHIMIFNENLICRPCSSDTCLRPENDIACLTQLSFQSIKEKLDNFIKNIVGRV